MNPVGFQFHRTVFKNSNLYLFYLIVLNNKCAYHALLVVCFEYTNVTTRDVVTCT